MKKFRKMKKNKDLKKVKKVLTFLQSNLINLNELLLGKAFKFHSVEVTTILQQWVKSNLVNPYPSHEIKLQLATQTNLTYTQINVWFKYERRKLNKTKTTIFNYE